MRRLSKLIYCGIKLLKDFIYLKSVLALARSTFLFYISNEDFPIFIMCASGDTCIGAGGGAEC